MSTATGSVPLTGADEPVTKKSRKKLFVILAAVVVLLGGGYVAMGKLKKKPAAGHAAAAVVQPGVVSTLDPITVNLADGHYLRVGIALQLAKGVDAKAVDGAEALDIAIDVLSGRDQAHLGSARGREAAKTAITTRVRATPAYGKKVLSLYFTDFVMQ